MVVITFWTVQNFKMVPILTLDNWIGMLTAGYFWSAYIQTIAYAALAAVIARPPDPVPAKLAKLAGTAAGSVPPPRRAPGQVFTRQALTAANGFAGADGIFRLLRSGLVERGFAVMEVRARRFVVVSPAPLTFQKIGN